MLPTFALTGLALTMSYIFSPRRLLRGRCLQALAEVCQKGFTAMTSVLGPRRPTSLQLALNQTLPIPRHHLTALHHDPARRPLENRFQMVLPIDDRQIRRIANRKP